MQHGSHLSSADQLAPSETIDVWAPLFLFDLVCICTYEMRAKFWPLHHLGSRGTGGSIPAVFLSPLRWWSPSLRPPDTLLLAVTVSGLPGLEARLPVSLSVLAPLPSMPREGFVLGIYILTSLPKAWVKSPLPHRIMYFSSAVSVYLAFDWMTWLPHI